METQIIELICSIADKYEIKSDDFFYIIKRKQFSGMTDNEITAFHKVLSSSILTSPDVLATYIGCKPSRFRMFLANQHVNNVVSGVYLNQQQKPKSNVMTLDEFFKKNELAAQNIKQFSKLDLLPVSESKPRKYTSHAGRKRFNTMMHPDLIEKLKNISDRHNITLPEVVERVMCEYFGINQPTKRTA